MKQLSSALCYHMWKLYRCLTRQQYFFCGKIEIDNIYGDGDGEDTKCFIGWNGTESRKCGVVPIFILSSENPALSVSVCIPPPSPPPVSFSQLCACINNNIHLKLTGKRWLLVLSHWIKKSVILNCLLWRWLIWCQAWNNLHQLLIYFPETGQLKSCTNLLAFV